MEKREVFKSLILLARPAAGKSEIIQFLNGLDADIRKNDFHIGNIHAIDDFPMIWSWFEEDDILSNMGLSRIHTDEHGYFLNKEYWNLLIERINLEYIKHENNITPQERYQETIVIEFSRGAEHGGYKMAFSHLITEILSTAAILYINVSWEESLRKNRIRFNPKKPYSILEHGLPDDKMRRLYHEMDWDEFSKNDPHYINIRGISVPYIVMENEDDVTSANNKDLNTRLHSTLGILWKSYNQ